MFIIYTILAFAKGESIDFYKFFYSFILNEIDVISRDLDTDSILVITWHDKKYPKSNASLDHALEGVISDSWTYEHTTQ